MTSITIDLPAELAQQAEQAGLLTPEALRELLKDAVRRRAFQALLAGGKRAQEAGGEAPSDEEICQEVKAVRRERRERQKDSLNK